MLRPWRFFFKDYVVFRENDWGSMKYASRVVHIWVSVLFQYFAILWPTIFPYVFAAMKFILLLTKGKRISLSWERQVWYNITYIRNLGNKHPYNEAFNFNVSKKQAPENMRAHMRWTAPRIEEKSIILHPTPPKQKKIVLLSRALPNLLPPKSPNAILENCFKLWGNTQDSLEAWNL